MIQRCKNTQKVSSLAHSSLGDHLPEKDQIKIFVVNHIPSPAPGFFFFPSPFITPQENKRRREKKIGREITVSRNSGRSPFCEHGVHVFVFELGVAALANSFTARGGKRGGGFFFVARAGWVGNVRGETSNWKPRRPQMINIQKEKKKKLNGRRNSSCRGEETKRWNITSQYAQQGAEQQKKYAGRRLEACLYSCRISSTNRIKYNRRLWKLKIRPPQAFDNLLIRSDHSSIFPVFLIWIERIHRLYIRSIKCWYHIV